MYIEISENWIDDNTVYNKSKKGFRLITYNEWELTAEYIDGKKWFQGDHANRDENGTYGERAITVSKKSESGIIQNYIWDEGNCERCPNSNFYMQKGTPPVTAVGSNDCIPFSGLVNHLDIYEMHGNVCEWYFNDFQCRRL